MGGLFFLLFWWVYYLELTYTLSDVGFYILSGIFGVKYKTIIRWAVSYQCKSLL